MSSSQFSKKKKSTAIQTLGDYVKASVVRKGLNKYQAAMQMGISNSYVSDIANNKFVPSIRILKVLAEFFGDSTLYVMRLAAGIGVDALADELALEIAEALAKDRLLRDLYETYTRLKTQGEREAMARVVGSFFPQDY